MKIVLRPVVSEDLAVLFQHQAEPEANRMANFPARSWDEFHNRWEKILADAAVDALAVTVDGMVAGNVIGWNQDERRLVGYWIGMEFWNRGVASEALRQYLAIATIRPLHAFVAKHNAASLRVLEKCGFERCEEFDDEWLLELAK